MCFGVKSLCVLDCNNSLLCLNDSLSEFYEIALAVSLPYEAEQYASET